MLALVLFGDRWEESLDEFEASYGIDVQYEEPELPVQGQRPRRWELAIAVPQLVEELSRYPAPTLDIVGIQRIILLRGLTTDFEEVAGVSFPEEGSILVNVPFQAGTIHHEVFHLIDVDSWNFAWYRLNLRGFSYGQANLEGIPREGWKDADRSSPGFITPYAMTSIKEDKAELYSFLVTSPDLVRELAENDPIIARKVDMLKANLASLSTGFDGDFWED